MITHKILHELGLTRNYKGYWQLYIVIQLVCQEPERLTHIIKDVYEVVAQECNCSVWCIERNIRTLIFKVWETHRKELILLTESDLQTPPTTAIFIDLISNCVLSQSKNKLL